MDLPGYYQMIDVVKENVLVQSDNLKTHPSVSSAIRLGKVQIYGWVYNFESGTITIYDPREQKYLPSIEVKDEAEKNTSRFAMLTSKEFVYNFVIFRYTQNDFL